ncbi:MAG: energy-coupling factor transporter transmembrane protein EcfT [Erysipelotrichaceae bacterium]|nr:energy-coupling factor transporter transmembrane protein EcfT [Erysipelotrichaceae bacterium]
MNGISLGKYLPLDSCFHRLDPRAKIGALLMVMIAIFLPAGFLGYFIIGASVLVATYLSKLRLNFLWKAMKPMLFMLIFLLIVNLLVIKEGTLLFQIGSFGIYSGSLVQTLYIVIRLTLMVIITTILTATTKPLDLTLGIEDLLKPLKKCKVPAEEIAMMISLALRFIPTLMEETQRIMKAQMSRGIDLEEGKLKEKIMSILSLIVPLFVSAFQRAADLADAMEARGYVPSQPRTRYKQLRMQKKDYLFLIICLGIIIANIILWRLS